MYLYICKCSTVFVIIESYYSFLHNIYYLLCVSYIMSIFNFFRQKKKLDEKITKEYSLVNLPSLIEDEIRNINNKSEMFKNELKDMTNNLFTTIKQKIPELKLINLDKRKEEQRLKDIVITNLYDYIYYLEKLVEDLEKVDSKDLEKYIERIKIIFNNFSKSSNKVYERVTILIGKELSEVRNLINDFAKNFNESLALNKENFDRTILINSIKDNLKELEEAKKIQSQIEDSIVDFERKIVKIEEEKKLTEKSYEEYKESKELKNFIEEQKKIIQENKIISEDIIKLKQKINLKDLEKYFHDNPKKSSKIKKYFENFSDSLKEDSSLEIVTILREANQKFDEEKIKNLRQEILDQKKFRENVKLKELENIFSKLDSELKYGHSKIEKEKEKIPKFEEKQKQILTKMEETAKKIWPDFKI